MATNYKTAIGFLKHLGRLALDQDMSTCNDWDKLTSEEQKMFYAILAGMQNDLGEIQASFNDRNANIEVYG